MCKIYYEQETPNEKACCRYNYEEPESPNEGTCFKIYDEPDSPSKGGVVWGGGVGAAVAAAPNPLPLV